MRSWRSALERVRKEPRAALRTAIALARGHYYRAKFRILGRRVVIGRLFQVTGPLVVRGPGTVIFGDECAVVSSRIAPTTPFTHNSEAVIRFGNRVLLTGTRLSCERSIEVGDHTGLSDARIMDTDFHAVESYGEPRYNTSGVSKAISIGSNVWVGAGAMILKGVKIGDNSVVGAGAVVASRVPPNTVVFGTPARVIWRLRERLADVAVPQEARESMSWTSGSPPAHAHGDMTQLGASSHDA
jgi:acetyltransferase-like isoleucine patch superfamily enzyme